MAISTQGIVNPTKFFNGLDLPQEIRGHIFDHVTVKFFPEVARLTHTKDGTAHEIPCKLNDAAKVEAGTCSMLTRMAIRERVIIVVESFMSGDLGAIGALSTSADAGSASSVAGLLGTTAPKVVDPGKAATFAKLYGMAGTAKTAKEMLESQGPDVFAKMQDSFKKANATLNAAVAASAPSGKEANVPVGEVEAPAPSPNSAMALLPPKTVKIQLKAAPVSVGVVTLTPAEMMTLAPVLLGHATKLYQPVLASSQSSRYFVVALRPDLKLAARFKDGKLSVRAEGSVGVYATKLKHAGLSEGTGGQPYFSAHFLATDTLIAAKTLGAVLGAVNLEWVSPAPQIERIAGLGQ